MNFADVICIFASCATLLVQEIIAILLAVDTFADLLENRRIVLYSDNKGEVTMIMLSSASMLKNRSLIAKKEAVGTTTRAYFSYSCCVGEKHHANHGCVCVLADVIRSLLLA